ncbi:MAG: ATP-binding protein [Gemmatimonadaceae bacterium]|nr:ATP-binding protein [Gemmatimonadaceae bacterium]
MRTLRARLAVAVTLLIGVTLLVFTSLLAAVRREQATIALQRQVLDEADLAVRLIGKANELPADGDTVRASAVALLRSTLEGFPGWLVVLDDSGRARYASFAVRQLGQDDLAQLLQASLALSETRPAVKVRLSDEQLLIVAREVPRSGNGQSRRVVAGASTRPLDLFPPELLRPIILLVPIVLLIAAFAAWLMTGRTLAPIERLRADAEAITDGRSLHRRLHVPDGTDPAEDELARLSVTLNQMIERLETSFAALRRFTADASHELKTPLTVLRADIERAMSVSGAPAEQLVPLEEALAESARMADLVDGLLTLARADEGRFDLVREPVPLEALVRDVYETALILGEDAGLTVELPIIEDGVVLGDAQRMRQLMLNLVTNAIKYTPRGGTVTLTLSRRLDGIAFTVKDTGIGIAAADLPYVFDRFWRADRARTRGGERAGTGLGLAISQWIAQAHAGTLAVQSRLGRGSIFTATFPLAPEEASA